MENSTTPDTKKVVFINSEKYRVIDEQITFVKVSTADHYNYSRLHEMMEGKIKPPKPHFKTKKIKMLLEKEYDDLCHMTDLLMKKIQNLKTECMYFIYDSTTWLIESLSEMQEDTITIYAHEYLNNDMINERLEDE